jgi:RNA polymerase sigma factor (sigma-70 family)
MPSSESADWPEDLASHARTAGDAGLPAAVRCQAVRALAAIASDDGFSEETRNPILNLLAGTAGDERESREIREEAFNALRPLINLTAKVVSVPFAVQTRSDLLQEAESYVWERIGKFRPGRFESWCHTVLRNLVLDWLRRKRVAGGRAPPVGPNVEGDGGNSVEPETSDFRPVLEAALDRQTAFSAADVRRIEEWRLRERVVLLCLSGLWDKVAREKWATWLRDCGVVMPFPPSHFAAATERQRNAILASALGITRNNLAQQWSRGRKLLRGLDYLRDLCHDT